MEQMYFKVPYIINFTYILQFIHTSIAEGQMHILRPAWVIIVLCSNPSFYAGRSVSLCNTHCTAISTAVRSENLLVPSSSPSRNCLVSICSAINFFEKRVLSSFLLPSIFSSLFKSTRMRTVVAWSCVMLSLWSGVLKSWARLMGCARLPFPDAHSFPTGNVTQGWQRHSKQQELTMMATCRWSLQRTCFTPPAPVVISYVYKFIFLFFFQNNCHSLQNVIKLAERTFLSGRFQYFGLCFAAS